MARMLAVWSRWWGLHRALRVMEHNKLFEAPELFFLRIFRNSNFGHQNQDLHYTRLRKAVQSFEAVSYTQFSLRALGGELPFPFYCIFLFLFLFYLFFLLFNL